MRAEAVILRNGGHPSASSTIRASTARAGSAPHCSYADRRVPRRHAGERSAELFYQFAIDHFVMAITSVEAVVVHTAPGGAAH